MPQKTRSCPAGLQQGHSAVIAGHSLEGTDRLWPPTSRSRAPATLKPIREIAERAESRGGLEPYGKYKAKIALDFVAAQQDRPDGALVLVTASARRRRARARPPPRSGLGDALNLLGTKTMIALREPSLGPCFGMKGGATGGGHAQVLPMEDINLHFTGDFHAITSANNLLSAMVDNHVYWGNGTGLDARA